jgi:hypothetical protein
MALPLQAADPFCHLDWLLRHTAKALQSWSERFIGNVWVQLVIANDLVLQLESATDLCALAPHVESLRMEIELKSLGLASLQRSIAQQEFWILRLGVGDAPTKFFQVNAKARRCKKFIHSVDHDCQVLVSEEWKAKAFPNFFDVLLGSPAPRLDSCPRPRSIVAAACNTPCL